MGRIAELEQRTRDLRQDTRELRSLLDGALDRICQLEAATPEARQARYEADVALADLAASDYDDEPKLEPEEYEQYDPGPECDDVGGASEHQYLITPEEDPW